MKTAIKSLLLLASMLLLAGCLQSQSSVTLGGERFTVEVADTPAEQTRGLMFRDELAEGHGMLFVYPEPFMQAYWMKNVRFPIDILFFDRGRRLINVASGARPCRRDPCPRYRSERPAMYVLELNAGVAEALGVSPGDELVLSLD